MKNILVALLLPLLLLAACDSSSTKGGDDQVATQCLAFSPAEQSGDQFRHKVHNTCKKTIQVLDAVSEQRFTILASGNIEVNLASSTPSMGACFDPYTPERSGDQFKCTK